MGVCCIVFDIDGMLFEFFMNFLNIEKNKIFNIFFFQYFKFSSRFMLFPILKKKNKYWKVPLHLLVKWEVVSPNSGEGQLESIYIISSIPLFWFCISNVGGGGGVVMFFSHFMLFPTFLEKKIWEYKTIISHLMFSSCFFCMLEIL